MENILEISDLCKNYDDFSLKNVSFSLPRGYIMGFVGQNGSGKTTTIRSILNMSNPDGGKISVLGLDSVKDSVEIKDRTGVVFDQMYFGEHMSAKQIEKQLKPFYSKWSTETFFEYLKKFELPDNKAVGKFSKGMKMKLMITAALSHNAELIILDEPTSGLDPVARDELLDILAEFIEDENKGILFSTHITADVERIADFITVLHNGSVWFSGTKDELSEKYAVVKGDPKDITDQLKEKMMGFHIYRNGFDALIDTEYLNEVPESVETEKASIDEILVYIAKEDKYAKRT